ncbi:glycosyltransferase family 2 protein [Azospirillum picis]|uniref:Glycosyltransferase involved in cell wall biosynthesis n=1 Tax=Azospirillum picis TaxID=488438 RepID=A0ABU0MSD2_9PROT|nr:glycosyltransferase family A protein [Azospirillum picis]MBP2300846.1 glycosyltransferase involved in cell wall biosynthesis [Azospirillum picis]MDQ0536103.1 glycosyltransferase involved in cell wall biosynthesis [Azospirillum picis]
MASVDVVVPSYQYGRYLRGCVTSVLTQDIADLRVLIIDNASTDDSVEVARRLAAEDRRVEVLARPRNLGPHASFNDGIDWARADYFLILCADDLLAPGALARAAAVMERHPGVHLSYGGVVIDSATDPRPSRPAPATAAGWRILSGSALLERFCRTGRNHVPGPTAVVRTSIQKQVGHYRRTLPQTDDLEVWMRFALRGDAAETDVIQGIARVHPLSQSASSRTVHDWNVEFLAAFETFFADDGAALPQAGRLRRLARRALAERAYWCAASHLARGDAALARDLLRFSVRLAPSTAVLPPLTALLRRPDTLERLGRLSADLAAPLRRRFDGSA